MNIKRYLSFIFALVLVVSLTACKGKDNPSVTQESTTVADIIVNETVSESVADTEVVSTENASQQVVQDTSSSSQTTIISTETEAATTVIF